MVVDGVLVDGSVVGWRLIGVSDTASFVVELSPSWTGGVGVG